MALSIYQLKPAFQQGLRPAVTLLHGWGVTANQVTLAACALSVALGLALYALPLAPAWFALLAPWLFVRMALNAIDGMLAREHNQKSRLGAVLNEMFNLSPRGIREMLGLSRAIYARTSAYGHFGRAPEADGGFSWEKRDLVDQLRRAFN